MRVAGEQSVGAAILRSRRYDPRSWARIRKSRCSGFARAPQEQPLAIIRARRGLINCDLAGPWVAGAPAARQQPPSVIRDRRLIEKAFGFPCASRGGSIDTSPSGSVEREAAASEERVQGTDFISSAPVIEFLQSFRCAASALVAPHPRFPRFRRKRVGTNPPDFRSESYLRTSIAIDLEK